MKYKWLIGVGLLSFILTGCASVTPSNMNSTPNQIQQTQQQSIEHDNQQTPSEPPSDLITTMTTVDTEENKQNEIELPDELLIDGWKVGIPFSEVIDKLPIYSELDSSYMQYLFKAQNLNLSFTWGGILQYISTSEHGKGLNVNLKVGDKEQQITKILGMPETMSNTNDGYSVYIYSFETYDLEVISKDDFVQVIALQLTGRPTIDETVEISEYYNAYIAAKNPKLSEKPQVAEQPQQEPQNNRIPETKSNEQKTETTKYATRVELIELRDDFLKRYKALLGLISNDSSDTEKLNTIFSEVDFNQIELYLETALPHWSSKDKNLGRLVTEFVEATLDVYQWQIIKNNSNDDQIRVNASYEIRDAIVRAQNTELNILVIINSK